MIIKYISEGTFDSYKNKLSKEDKLKNLKKETSKIIKQDIIKKLFPLIQSEILKAGEKIDKTKQHFGHYPILKITKDDDGNCTPILEIDDSNTLIVKVPMHFITRLGKDLIFNNNEIFSEIYPDTFNRYFFSKNENINNILNEYEITNIKIKILLTDDDTIFNGIRFNHFSSITKEIYKFFEQFDKPIHLVTKVFDTHFSFGYENDLSEYKELAKYITVTEEAHITIQNNESLDNIDDIREIFDKNSSEITVYLLLPNCKKYGPNPAVKPVSEELLKKYFGLTYKEIIESNPIKEWGRAISTKFSRLDNIRFIIKNPFNFNKLEDIKFNCTKY